jgi:hypothetical protein
MANIYPVYRMSAGMSYLVVEDLRDENALDLRRLLHREAPWRPATYP